MHPGSHHGAGGSGHGHGQGHTHHAGCSHGQQHHIQPQQYFKQLKDLKQKNVEFYWMEVVKGTVLAKYLQHYGLNFLNGMNAHIIQSIVGMAHMMLTCDFMPLFARPFVSGMFWPLLLFVFINYKIITGFGNQQKTDSVKETSINQNLDRSANLFIIVLPVILYILVALRTSGKLNTPQNKRRAKRILQVRPYLQNPNLMCRTCEIPKAFRTTHCPMCKVCVPKFSRHSLVFGVCVGAANQLLAILFFLSMSIFCTYFLYKFTMLHSLFGIITQVMLYVIHICILWMSATQFCGLFLLNIKFGLTQFQIQNWMMLQYLMKAPVRQFINSCNNGIIHNLAEDIYALFGVSGFEAELYDPQNDSQEKEHQPLRQQISQNTINVLGFPDIKDGIKYIVNWDKAYIYVIPQMPNNPRRKDILQIMKVEEPRMIENFKLIKSFKKEAQQQNPDLNQFQIQQKAMAKMQQHMMKNPQAASMLKPPPQQQKIIQLQMIGHMKMQFKQDPEIFMGFQQIQSKLKSGTIGPDEAGLGMRALQQKIMQKKMSEILNAQKKQEDQNSAKKDEEIVNKQQKSSPVALQSLMQAQMLQKLQQRSKQISKQQEKNDDGHKKKKVQKQQESDKLKEEEEIIDDQNL